MVQSTNWNAMIWKLITVMTQITRVRIALCRRCKQIRQHKRGGRDIATDYKKHARTDEEIRQIVLSWWQRYKKKAVVMKYHVEDQLMYLKLWFAWCWCWRVDHKYNEVSHVFRLMIQQIQTLMVARLSKENGTQKNTRCYGEAWT